MTHILALFDGFFLGAQAAESFRVFNVLFGLTVMTDAFVFARYAEYSFGANGFLPRGQKSSPRFEFLSFVDHSRVWLKLAFAPMLLAGLGLILNFHTEICAGVIFLSLSSALGKNPYGQHSGRKLALIWAFLLMFPSHWALQLMRIQLCIVYFVAVAHKFQHKNWLDGSMVYKVLTVSTCRTEVPMPGLVTYRMGSAAMTWMTMLCQAVAPVLLWSERTFWIGAAMIWGMHLGMQVYLNISTFQFYMLCGPLLFLPESVISQYIKLLAPI